MPKRYVVTGAPHFGWDRAERRVSVFYFYLWDEDFGPAFIKIASYFPYPIKVWLNGHEWAKRQATKSGIGFTPLANGFAATVVTAEGFTRFADRPRRLRLLLDAYGYTRTVPTVLDAVRARIEERARGLRELAAAGDPLFTRLVDDGVIDGLNRAMAQLDQDAATFDST